MTDPTAIPHLPAFDTATLDSSFAVLAEEVRSSAAAQDAESFRLNWLGRKQGRLKLISEAWLKSAPPEAKKALGTRFNQLKHQIEAALAGNRHYSSRNCARSGHSAPVAEDHARDRRSLPSSRLQYESWAAGGVR